MVGLLYSASKAFKSKMNNCSNNMSTVTVTKSIDYKYLLNQVIEFENDTGSPSKDLWIKMAQELEDTGFEKRKIWSTVAKDIEDAMWIKFYKKSTPREEFKWNMSGYYYRVGADAGYSNSDYNKFNTTTAPLGELGNSSIYTPNVSVIVLCNEIMNVCRTIKEKAQDAEPLEVIFGEKLMSEFYRQRMVMVNNCKNAIDDKTKVPNNTEVFLLECMATVLGNTNKCAQIFMEQNLIHLKEQGKFLTSKQATKFQKGGKQSQQFILQPISRETALYDGSSGIRCTGCGSWKVYHIPTGLECYNCDKKLPKQFISKCNFCQIPLYKERLLHIVKTSCCENCNNKIDLPQELIDYANS